MRPRVRKEWKRPQIHTLTKCSKASEVQTRLRRRNNPYHMPVLTSLPAVKYSHAWDEAVHAPAFKKHFAIEICFSHPAFRLHQTNFTAWEPKIRGPELSQCCQGEVTDSFSCTYTRSLIANRKAIKLIHISQSSDMTLSRKWKSIPNNNIHTKISAFWLAESMSINPKQCKNQKFFERRKTKLVRKVEIKNDWQVPWNTVTKKQNGGQVCWEQHIKSKFQG